MEITDSVSNDDDILDTVIFLSCIEGVGEELRTYIAMCYLHKKVSARKTIMFFKR